MYSDAIRMRFMRPQFAGVLAAESILHVMVGAQEQGAVIALWARVDPQTQRIIEARFKAYGCGACIATADYLCELLIGLSPEQLEQFDTQYIANALELPSVKLHCIWLASEAVEQLLFAWRQTQASLVH